MTAYHGDNTDGGPHARLAVVTDSQVAGMAEAFAKHFTSAEVKHFPFTDDVKALDWLRTA